MKRAIHHGALVVILLAVAVLSDDCVARGAPASAETFCPGGSKPDPSVIVCEDFEDDAFQARWSISSRGGRWKASDFVLCTDDRFGFQDRCAAWSNQLLFDTAWGYWGYSARTDFRSAPELYIRWYQYISNPFIWGRLEDKSLLLRDRGETIIGYVGTNRNHLPVEPNSGPGMPFVANYQDLDWAETGGQYSKANRFQNQGQNITLEPGKWYLFEWYVKLNAPGVSNGITRLWVDDATQPITGQTLRLQHTDMRWLKSSDLGKQFGTIELTVYDQRCDSVPNVCPPRGPSILNQSQRWDDIVVSTRPIGPIAERGHRPQQAR
jgi:hypothetical protein